MKKVITTIAILTVLLPCLALADVPAAFSYQGILADSLGDPVEDDVYAIQFRIYEDSATSTSLWESNGFIPLQTVNGLFSYVMGTTNPLPDSLSRYGNLWVGITIDLDDEMMPRTPLTSVPFALSAQYADTANISLDKTIDASELTTGTLDTARYSAYEDLVSEDKTGDGMGQLAEGDHEHTNTYPSGAMIRYEDETNVEIVLPQNTSVIVKSVTFPPNQIGGYFKVSFSLRYHDLANNYLWLKCNNESVYSDNYSNEAWDILTFEFVKYNDSLWVGNYTSLYSGALTNPLNLNVSPGLTIEIVAVSDGINTTLGIGNFIVQYDAD